VCRVVSPAHADGSEPGTPVERERCRVRGTHFEKNTLRCVILGELRDEAQQLRSQSPPLPGGTWFGCGNGFAVYRETLMKRYAERLAAVDVDIRPRAQEIARLAVPRFERGEGGDAATAAPLYVRDKVALKTHER
jgi:tRNA A37 threonylcarbamoyladenosine modification protein TsaB